MDPRRFSFAVVALDAHGAPEWLRGNAFPIDSTGGLLTCRHVVDVDASVRLAVVDRERDPDILPITDVILPADADLDLAFLPGVLQRSSHQIPLLPVNELMVGHDVQTYGLYSQFGRYDSLRDGYFNGNVVSFQTNQHSTAGVSFPVIEGLPGSPITRYHNGTKVVGVCTGNEIHRVRADEVINQKDGDKQYVEVVDRVVEFGVALRTNHVEMFAEESEYLQPLFTADRVDDDQLG